MGYMALIELEEMANGKLGDGILVKTGEQGAVLRLLLKTIVVKKGGELTFPMTRLRKQDGEVLATFIWRPPWFGTLWNWTNFGNRLEMAFPTGDLRIHNGAVMENYTWRPPWRRVENE